MFKIRKATIFDALGITIVNVYTWKTTYSGIIPEYVLDSRIAKLIERTEKCKENLREGKDYYVAVYENTIVGFCWYGKSRNKNFKDSGEIYALYVLKGFQGMSIGKELLLKVKEEFKEIGYKSFIVNCAKENSSLGFYISMGGRSVGEFQDGDAENSIIDEILEFNI
ncbi:GNAT family N-acetyltransferase [Inconstantimicrobium mannanitabidum]|uniref:N-acetyltransferase GCN5 n=1 Tax=Inconstantimicrobium mannanitabidum TaxID=1604901 RepID=A0ACB5RBK0_9CLOT|nr:GNAT family N-acetyltransferase [Clostridium sp. TW13]GKX66416.1 N-acetyltransferase GCN5 [Clostridium sp. TW13]